MSARPNYDEEQFEFVENLSNSKSHLRTARGHWVWEPHGFVGSIQEVPRSLKQDFYVRRAITRGRIRFLNSDEVTERMDQLVEREESAAPPATQILDAMKEGVSDQFGRIKRDVPDGGREMGEIDPSDVWSGKKPAPRQNTVRRASVPSNELDKPLPPAQVLTDPVKEGEWESEYPR